MGIIQTKTAKKKSHKKTGISRNHRIVETPNIGGEPVPALMDWDNKD